MQKMCRYGTVVDKKRPVICISGEQVVPGFSRDSFSWRGVHGTATKKHGLFEVCLADIQQRQSFSKVVRLVRLCLSTFRYGQEGCKEW